MTRYTARFIHEVHRRRTLPSILRPLRHIYYDTYLTCAYLFVKLLYAANVVGQLFLLDLFLGTDFRLYGVSVLQRMVAGQDWTTSTKFPRVTLCDMKIRWTASSLLRLTVPLEDARKSQRESGAERVS